ncbi:succinate-semialdehyde dehydrogenase / glutarate-semialdehyde dehydrogenase [Burkholderiales bacterium]|nr:succinate-semialdehyde dehydrogenase / glutarate-semialdehyde dehydrogenase [Burkholderiales bacterium]
MPDRPALSEMMNERTATSLPTRNPRTGACDGRIVVFSAEAVAAKAQALRGAQIAWERCGAAGRAAVLAAWAERLDARREALLEALLADSGRWRESALEIEGALSSLRRWAKEGPELLAAGAEEASAVPGYRLRQSWRPYHLVGVISPWNFPLLLALIDAIPALLAGCAVLIKPSEVTSRFVAVVEASLGELPELASVLGFVTGAAATGEALIESVDAICFTGSVRTGRKVGEHAARRFIPSSLELGGKDPAIVCADADLPRAARALTWGGMVNAGQSCMSIERVYVARRVFEPFVARLSREVGALRFCFPDARQGEIGPIIAEAQVAVIREQLAAAYREGARATVGGQLQQLGGGWWCEPTVLVDVRQDMAIVREETFAAILAVLPFESEDEAIALANDSDYGLSAAVFAGDLDRAAALALRLDAGAVSINDASLTAVIHDAAKQSFKFSGLGGSRMGKASIARFGRQQALLINAGQAAPWWFPSAAS